MQDNDSAKKVDVQDVQLEEIKQEEKKEEAAAATSTKTTRSAKSGNAKFTPPKIVKDEEVKEEEKPPEVEKLEETKIGTMNQEGQKDEGIVAPPVEDGGKGVVEAPKKDDEDWDKTLPRWKSSRSILVEPPHGSAT